MPISRIFLILSAMMIMPSAGMADHLYGGATKRFGPDCKRLYKQTGQGHLIVGSVLGGQNRGGRWGDGTFRDYRTFQACFLSVAACEMWTARHASLRPHSPGYARCTPVYVGLTPPVKKAWFGVEARPVRARY